VEGQEEGREKGREGEEALMNIPMDAPDPRSNLIEFKREKRTGTLEPVRRRYNDCQHERAQINEGSRSVTCAKCKAALDAFDVLYELATKQRRWLEELDAWDAYRDSKLSERYDTQWERDHEEVTEPPEEPALRRIWDTFAAYLKGNFCAMYKRKQRKRKGPEWYGRSTTGGIVSYEYARSRMVPQLVQAQK
jgi:hypothetical protein